MYVQGFLEIKVRLLKAVGVRFLIPQGPQTKHMCAQLYLNFEYRGTSLIRNNPLVGPYSRTMPRALWKSWGGGAFSY